jgi:hypothetical protein
VEPRPPVRQPGSQPRPAPQITTTRTVQASATDRRKIEANASLLIKAQSEAVRFNAMAASGQPDRGVTSGPAEDSAHYDTGVAAELERLAALHSSGMLDDEEFRAAKARIIHGG